MKKSKVLIFIALVVCFVITIVVGISIFTAYKLQSPSDIYAQFDEDYQQLDEIAEYLNSIENDSITITFGKPYMIVDFGEEKEFENNEIKKSVLTLFTKGYLRIEKTRDTVNFERWTNPISGFAAGYAYDFSNEGTLDIQFLTKQQEMSVAGWYYYEDDYNDWRSRKSIE